jgi:hypothetical protein
MLNSKVQLLLVMAVCSALGYAAASNKFNPFQKTEAAPSSVANANPGDCPTGLCEGTGPAHT